MRLKNLVYGVTEHTTGNAINLITINEALNHAIAYFYEACLICNIHLYVHEFLELMLNNVSTIIFGFLQFVMYVWER